MTPEQIAEIINHIDAMGFMVGGFVLALIVAATWRG